MLAWLKRKLGITLLEQSSKQTQLEIQAMLKSVTADIESTKRLIDNEINMFQDSVRIDAELGMRGKNTIVLTGVYKNRGYVEFYDLDHPEFHEFVERLKYMRKDNLIRHIDGPFGFDFKGFFDIGGDRDCKV
jgi:hypothetical protein